MLVTALTLLGRSLTPDGSGCYGGGDAFVGCSHTPVAVQSVSVLCREKGHTE